MHCCEYGAQHVPKWHSCCCTCQGERVNPANPDLRSLTNVFFDKIWDEFGMNLVLVFYKIQFFLSKNYISSIIVSIHSALLYDVCWFASGLPGILES